MLKKYKREKTKLKLYEATRSLLYRYYLHGRLGPEFIYFIDLCVCVLIFNSSVFCSRQGLILAGEKGEG